MNCPVCNINLQMMDKQGVTIDYCPQCRGVWLDRGELERLIEKSNEYSNAASSSRGNSDRDYQQKPVQQDYYDKEKSYKHDGNYHHKKKESFLADIFDF